MANNNIYIYFLRNNTSGRQDMTHRHMFEEISRQLYERQMAPVRSTADILIYQVIFYQRQLTS